MKGPPASCREQKVHYRERQPWLGTRTHSRQVKCAFCRKELRRWVFQAKLHDTHNPFSSPLNCQMTRGPITRKIKGSLQPFHNQKDLRLSIWKYKRFCVHSKHAQVLRISKEFWAERKPASQKHAQILRNVRNGECIGQRWISRHLQLLKSMRTFLYSQSTMVPFTVLGLSASFPLAGLAGIILQTPIKSH